MLGQASVLALFWHLHFLLPLQFFLPPFPFSLPLSLLHLPVPPSSPPLLFLLLFFSSSSSSYLIILFLFLLLLLLLLSLSLLCRLTHGKPTSVLMFILHGSAHKFLLIHWTKSATPQTVLYAEGKLVSVYVICWFVGKKLVIMI